MNVPWRARRSFSLTEWSQLPVGPGGLSEAEATALHRLGIDAARRLALPETAVLTRGHRSLRAGQVCGMLVAGDVSLEILPKVGHDSREARTALIRMLSVAHDLQIADGELAALESQRRDILDLLIALFARRLAEAVRPGLGRRYEGLRDALPFLRGRLEVKAQLTRRPVAPTRLECSYEEFHENTPLNRVLKASLRRLLPLARRAGTRRLLLDLLPRFEAVAESLRPLNEPVVLDRMTMRFRPSLALARLLLAGDWQTTSTGAAPGVALLFAMNDLFERYVGRRLRMALPDRDVRLQDARHHLLDHGAFRMMPDIVVAALTGPVILDTKWKRLDVAKGDALGIAQADLYQLAAYGHAYAREGVASLALVYPHIEPLGSEGLQRAWRVEGADLPLMIWTIDITKHRTGGAWRDLARWMVGDTEAPVIQVGRPAQLKAARRGRD
jgi:5-methylcytosine-specific restriction enzyme subunit McrC